MFKRGTSSRGFNQEESNYVGRKRGDPWLHAGLKGEAFDDETGKAEFFIKGTYEW